MQSKDNSLYGISSLDTLFTDIFCRPIYQGCRKLLRWKGVMSRKSLKSSARVNFSPPASGVKGHVHSKQLETMLAYYWLWKFQFHHTVMSDPVSLLGGDSRLSTDWQPPCLHLNHHGAINKWPFFLSLSVFICKLASWARDHMCLFS